MAGVPAGDDHLPPLEASTRAVWQPIPPVRPVIRTVRAPLFQLLWLGGHRGHLVPGAMYHERGSRAAGPIAQGAMGPGS
jgi:hypothetical protein